MSASPALPRPLAVLILATLACAFAGNHIAARIAFDHDTGLLLAILCRSGITLLALAAVVFWQRESLRLKAGTWRWQLLMGVLIATQSFCLYSAVARIPVALALLVGNTAPILLVLLNWALGGRAPSRQALLLMGMILLGLLFALDVPQRLDAGNNDETRWLEGILFGFAGAAVFACALWITEHKLAQIRGSVRSLLTLLVVFCTTALLGLSGLLPGGVSTPSAATGWLALGCLVLLYGVAFSLLFICVSRLDIVRNAPVMNVEPIASLLLGWLILDQLLSGMQVVGGLIVVGGIVLLTSRKPA